MKALFKRWIDRVGTDRAPGAEMLAAGQRNELAPRTDRPAAAPALPLGAAHRRAHGWLALLPIAAAAILGGCSGNPSPIVALTAVSFNPTSVKGGATSTGTVTLSAAAPANGAAVTLASSNPAVAPVPGSVTVAAGATSATFTVTTTAVTANTPVAIFAAEGGFSNMTTLTVTP